jgi:uncharacterized membrane protein YheB (UPF0754 family)
VAFAWPELAVSVAVGTVAGGITNAIAVWMLFHPYDTRFGLQGAIPKNKARLAKSIGRTVGEKLLTPADLVHELERSGMRDAVESKLADIVRDLLDHERGALTTELPPTVLAEVERVLAGLSALLAEAYAREVHDEAFAAKVRDFVARARTQVDGIPLARLLTPERQERLAQQAALLSTEIIESSRQDDGRTLRAKLGDYLLKIAGTERTERFVERTVRDALGRSEERTVGDLLGTLPDETYVDWILAAARSPRAAELAFGTAGKAARRLLDTPIGRPARYLPPDAAERLAAAAGPALWQWAMGRVPDLLGRLDIEAMVERKVLGFSTERLEQIVRQVTDRELKLIVRLGYVLGAAIGALSYLTRSLLPS